MKPRKAFNETTSKPGDIVKDGSIFVGIDEETQNALFAVAQDEPYKLSWEESRIVARSRNDHGHSDWRSPTRKELTMLFNARNEGAFVDAFRPVKYWTSERGDFFTDPYAVDLNNGKVSKFWNSKTDLNQVRFVRSVSLASLRKR